MQRELHLMQNIIRNFNFKKKLKTIKNHIVVYLTKTLHGFDNAEMYGPKTNTTEKQQ